MISQRTQALIDRVPEHPFAPTAKNAMIHMLESAERLISKRTDLMQSGRLTQRGLELALREELLTHMKALKRARAPIEKAQKDIKTRREAMTRKDIDRNDLVAALEREEIRKWFRRELNPIDRQALALTTQDQLILEAIVHAPTKDLTGLTGAMAHVYDKVEARYIEMQHGPEVAAISELEAVVAEANAAWQIARNMIQQATEMDDRTFSQVVEPIEKRAGAPWLVKNGDHRTMVCEVGADGLANYRPASPDEVLDGVFYASLEAYQQARVGA